MYEEHDDPVPVVIVGASHYVPHPNRAQMAVELGVGLMLLALVIVGSIFF